MVLSCPKVISLAPSVTETIEYLGKGKCLIATTVYTKDGRKKIGGIVDPDLEKIVSLKPDFVIATTLTPARIIKAIESAGIRVVVIRANTIDDIERNIKIIGTILNVRDLNEKVERFREVFRRRIRKKRGDVLIVVGCDNLIVAGRNTYLSQIFERYGFTNIAVKEGWYRINLEYLYKRKPEYIFTFCDLKLSFPFRVKVIKLKREKFLHPSPELIDALKELEVVIR